jgi:malonyl CoA-acyl carrier protein transacylase
VGTGKVLTGLVKRTLADVEAFNIETAEDLEAAASQF